MLRGRAIEANVQQARSLLDHLVATTPQLELLAPVSASVALGEELAA